jgi:four helix bundle protein
MTGKEKQFDLEERIACFAENLIAFLKTLKETTLNKPLISQIIRSGTSIGANYYEADVAESKKDFQHKIGICKKESKETCYWLRMLSNLHPERKEELRVLWKETHEFVLIFSKSILTSRKNNPH